MAETPEGTEPAAPVTFDLLEVRPTGRGLAGHVLQMRYPSVRFLIAQRRGQAGDPEYWEEVVDAVIEHDLDRDPGRLTPGQVGLIGQAWVAAMKERAVPPASGSSSDGP